MALSPGSRLFQYEILNPLGAGGMGEVYRARDSKLNRDVAVKVLSEAFTDDPARLIRFDREAKTLASLNHPNIVAIYDMGKTESETFIVMEYVEGKTLRDLLKAGPLPVEKALEVAVQVSDALAGAHEAGIVHRDLKPENILVKPDGHVKVVDFGVAKVIRGESGKISRLVTMPIEAATQEGVVLGTIAYLAPEQARCEETDFKADQFSFGLVLYEMLTGQHPFGRETALQTLSAIMETDPAPMGRLNPRVPAPLRWSVERCLNKTPGARYASTRDLAGELRTLQTHLPELISGTAPSPRLSLKSRYLRATLITIGALLVLCPSIYLLLFSGSRMNRSGDGTRPAQKEPEEQAVFQLGLFSKKILLDREKYKGFPISLDIQNAALRDVMNFFSEVSGRSIILDPQTGWEQYRLSTKLTEVPWDQALDLTCRMNGLGYVIEGKVIRVAPASNLERELEKLQRVIEQQRPPSQTTQ